MAESPLLDLQLDHRQGALHLKLAFRLTSPWTVLFGPSGSGKSTVLRSIAGLMRPERGQIAYEGKTLVDTSKRVFVPTHRRPVRGAAQTAWLMPHRTVEDCVVAGMSWQSHPTNQNELLDELLEVFRIKLLKERHVVGISGGERQRVSVAGAVAAAVTFDGPGKALLLLDEPFNGLGGGLRDLIAVELKDWLQRRKVPVLSVSHDVPECFLLGAEVIRIADGQLVDQGPVDRILAGERERILAELKG